MKKIIWALIISIIVLAVGAIFYFSKPNKDADLNPSPESQPATFTYEIKKSNNKQKLDFNIIRHTDSYEEVIFNNLYEAVADLLGYNGRYTTINVLTSLAESYEQSTPLFGIILLSNNAPSDKLYFTINPCPGCAPGGNEVEEIIAFDIETKTFNELNSSKEFYHHRGWVSYSVSPDGDRMVQLRRENNEIAGFDLANDKFSSIIADLGNENYIFESGGGYGGYYSGEITWLDNDKFTIEIFDKTKSEGPSDGFSYSLVKEEEYSFKEDLGL